MQLGIRASCKSRLREIDGEPAKAVSAVSERCYTTRQGTLHMRNVILIGMPGVGKSTVGRLLGQALGKLFIDTDTLIEQQEGRSLQDIIDRDGLTAFLRIEEHAILNMDINGHVVATGGSVVYSPRAMARLKENGTIFYLKVPYHEIKARITNEANRGIAMSKEQDLSGLYEERTPLYEAYADATIDCSGNDVAAIIATITAIVAAG
jgi:shikimate kinase